MFHLCKPLKLLSHGQSCGTGKVRMSHSYNFTGHTWVLESCGGGRTGPESPTQTYHTPVSKCPKAKHYSAGNLLYLTCLLQQTVLKQPAATDRTLPACCNRLLDLAAEALLSTTWCDTVTIATLTKVYVTGIMQHFHQPKLLPNVISTTSGSLSTADMFHCKISTGTGQV